MFLKFKEFSLLWLRVWCVASLFVINISCESKGIDMAAMDCEKIQEQQEKQNCREAKLNSKPTKNTYKEDLDLPSGFADKNKAKVQSDNTPLAKQYINKALFYHWNGEYYKAIDMFLKSIEVDPNSAQTWFKMGNTYTYIMKYQDALSAFDKAVELQPSMYDAHYNKAMLLKQMYNYREAINALDAALEAKSTFPKADFQLGTIYETLNQKDKAVFHYKRAYDVWHSYVLKNKSYFQNRMNSERIYLTCRDYLIREGIIKDDAFAPQKNESEVTKNESD